MKNNRKFYVARKPEIYEVAKNSEILRKMRRDNDIQENYKIKLWLRRFR